MAKLPEEIVLGLSRIKVEELADGQWSIASSELAEATNVVAARALDSMLFGQLLAARVARGDYIAALSEQELTETAELAIRATDVFKRARTKWLAEKESK